MAKKAFSAEQIIGKLREAEVLTSQGKTVSEVCRALSISDQTYYRWRCQPQVNLSTNRRVKKSPEKRIMCPVAFVKVRSTPPILPVRVTG